MKKTYAAPSALRAFGRRGPLMRHAVLQSLAVAAGATLDVSRVPRSAHAVSASRPAPDNRRAAGVDGSVIVLEN
jgi:hypothetical protein